MSHCAGNRLGLGKAGIWYSGWRRHVWRSVCIDKHADASQAPHSTFFCAAVLLDALAFQDLDVALGMGLEDVGSNPLRSLRALLPAPQAVFACRRLSDGQ